MAARVTDVQKIAKTLWVPSQRVESKSRALQSRVGSRVAPGCHAGATGHHMVHYALRLVKPARFRRDR